MKFRKPPVVEVWISINFDSNETKTEWDLDKVKHFTELSAEEFPKLEALQEQTIQVTETSPNDLPKVTGKDVRVEAVRLWNQERSRVMELRDDQLAFHVIKTSNQEPRFHVVREAVTPKLAEYVNVFQPSRIRHASLHYLDIIDIPKPASREISIKDYFRHACDLPLEPFGLITATTQQFQVICPTDPGPLFFRLQNLPSPEEENVFRFRMEWHKQSTEINSLDLEDVWRRMSQAHDYMRECFKAALTEPALALFEPYDETGET